jgi:transcriptional regulator with XRE-family HTH domain
MSEHEEVAAVAEKGDPKVLRHVVRSLRLRTGLKQREFGKASRVDQGNVSRYERGDVAPPEESLRRMAAAARVPWCLVVSMIRFYTALLSAADRGSLSLPASETEEAAPVERAALDSIEMAVIPYEFEEAVAEAEGPPPEEARREAAEICAALLPFPPAERRRLLGLSLRASRSWAVAEALAHASGRAAADEVEKAQELADLALFVARRVPGEAERARTAGYCAGFLANARRVATEFDEASEAFAPAWKLWRDGEAAASLPLAEWRLLDLEASLRREQHRFPEALERLERALTLCGGQPAEAGRILLKKEQVLYQMGDVVGALAALEQAAPLVEAAGDLHQLFALRFKTVKHLCGQERYAAAEALLPAVRELAATQGKKLDLSRVAWLATKVDSGQGRAEEAKAGLEQVIRDFADLPYEAALASLDLAVLYLKEGRTAEVQRLAVAMAWIFEAKGIGRESLAALALFCEAARQETATVELAKRVIAEVETAQRSASAA